MKLYYYNLVDANCSIFSKVKNQAIVFNDYKKEGYLDDFFFMEELGNDANYYMYNVGAKVIKLKKSQNKTALIYNWQVALKHIYTSVILFMKKNEYTHIYIRRSEYLDHTFIRFLKKLKEYNITILFEIPTYPYDMELRPGSFLAKLEVKNRVYLKNYVDIVVTPALHKTIFGISTINIKNGIVVDNVKPRKVELEENGDIHVIAVAGLAEWHGYDRFIKGLGEYYKMKPNRKVFFYLVGGDENNLIRIKYQKIVDEYSINRYVVFYGFRTGEDLDKLYNKSSIGVGSLGMHRIGINLASTLKTREYLAKGLPIITACKIDVLEENHPFNFMVPADETPINIIDIINYHDKIYQSGDYISVAEDIRQYAKLHCDMKNTMKPVIDYINLH